MNTTELLRDPLLTVKDVSQLLNQTTQATYCQRNRGQGPPFFRVGAKLLIRQSAFEAWLDSLAAQSK